MKNNQTKTILIKSLGRREYGTQGRTLEWGLFKCYCGNEFEARFESVFKGYTKSCGCLHKKKIIKANTKHGLSTHHLSEIWRSMKGRCYNKNNPKYYTYGARGIIVCDKWKNDLKSFYDWCILNGYKRGLTIDRINNDGNYEPSNCRWTTHSVQARNQKILIKSNTTGYKGVSKHGKKYQARIGIDYKDYNLGTFNTALDASLSYDKYVNDNNLEHTTNF